MVCVLGLVILWPHDATLFPAGMSDYTQLATGARLVGTPGLYDVDANLAEQKKLTGTDDTARLYTRLPWVALIWRPLTRLSYANAAHMFTAIMVACLVGFVWTRPHAERAPAAMALCWSVPAVSAITIGQDAPLVLLLVGMGQILIRSSPVVAGVLFALGSIKWHLIFLVPVVLLVRKEWRVLSGFLTASIVLLLICFVIQGRLWPFDYFSVLQMPEITRYPTIMPNLTGILWKVPSRLYGEIPASLIVVGLAVWSARKTASYEAVVLSLVGSLLISQHAYPQDALMVMPVAILLAARGIREPMALVLGMALLVPLTWMFSFWGRCLLVMAMIATLVESGFRWSSDFKRSAGGETI
jgi:hypothetical protein